MKGATVAREWESVAVECVHCHALMEARWGSGKAVRYFHCTSCRRWVSSTYQEVFAADAKVRPVPEEKSTQVAFEAVKDRLDRWLSALDDQDPYRLMGVSPMDSTDKLRQRFRELALQCHPDRGGSAERMSDLNTAYERIQAHRERRRAETAAGAKLPARSR